MVSARRGESQRGDARPQRRRLPGVNVRAGSVKQARIEAGLSLAQLGQGHVTAPAIYLIETGRTRPSLPTLEHIARRTGKPVEFFLAETAGGGADQTNLSLLNLMALLAEGRSQEAIRLGKWMLEQSWSAFQLDRIRHMLARAYIQASLPELAEPLLNEARAHFRAVNDRELLAECIAMQAELAIVNEPKAALALAQEALGVCRSISPVPQPLEARIVAVLAAAYAANRDWDAAIAAYEHAIEAASPLLDLKRMAQLYSGLGAAYHEIGEVQTAARHVMRSVALHEILHDRLLLARAENNLGLALMARGDYTGARPHLERALDLSEDSDQGFGRGQVLLSLCELAMHEARPADAEEFARQALERSHAGTVAEAHVWLGRIADARGDHEAADREFEAAITRFEGLDVTERLLHVHGLYAEVLERRGELARAYGHMKQALQASRSRSNGRPQQEEERASSA